MLNVLNQLCAVPT